MSPTGRSEPEHAVLALVKLYRHDRLCDETARRWCRRCRYGCDTPSGGRRRLADRAVAPGFRCI